jgi:hypothetical protein
MTIRWPVCALPPQDVSFDIAWRSLSAPASVSGAVQVVSSDAGIWKAKFSNVVVRKREAVLAFRGIANLLEGRLGRILVPLCRGYQPRLGGDLDAELVAKLPHSDKALFNDATGYVGQTIDARLAGSAAPRAVSASVNIAYGGVLEPGQHFSLGERLYRLRTVAYTSPTTAAITFRPPLREAAALGDRLEFDNPVCRMRLATDDAMDLELAMRRFGNPTVNFVEDV